MPLLSGINARGRLARLLAWIRRSVFSLAEWPPRTARRFTRSMWCSKVSRATYHIETRNPFSVASVACSKSDRAAERSLQCKGLTGLNVRMNELFKLPVHGRSNRQWDALVRAFIQLGRAVVGVEYTLREIRERKQ